MAPRHWRLLSCGWHCPGEQPVDGPRVTCGWRQEEKGTSPAAPCGEAQPSPEPCRRWEGKLINGMEEARRAAPVSRSEAAVAAPGGLSGGSVLGGHQAPRSHIPASRIPTSRSRVLKLVQRGAVSQTFSQGLIKMQTANSDTVNKVTGE